MPIADPCTALLQWVFSKAAPYTFHIELQLETGWHFWRRTTS